MLRIMLSTTSSGVITRSSWLTKARHSLWLKTSLRWSISQSFPSLLCVSSTCPSRLRHRSTLSNLMSLQVRWSLQGLMPSSLRRKSRKSRSSLNKTSLWLTATRKCPVMSRTRRPSPMLS
jgi:hypothetical protein